MLSVALVLGVGAPAFANHHNELLATRRVSTSNYVDQVPSWASRYIEVLTKLDVLEGYPDGTIRASNDITRAEFSVALVKGLSYLENSLHQAILAGDDTLYYQLAKQQGELISALARIDALEAEVLVERNNFVAISLGYGVANSNADDVSNIQLLGKVQVAELNKTLAISVRPFVTSDAVGGTTVTLDYDLNKDLTLYAGGGIAASWGNDTQLTGNTDVVGLITAGAEYELSKSTVAGIEVKLPTNGDQSWDPTVAGYVGLKF